MWTGALKRGRIVFIPGKSNCLQWCETWYFDHGWHESYWKQLEKESSHWNSVSFPCSTTSGLNPGTLYQHIGANNGAFDMFSCITLV